MTHSHAGPGIDRCIHRQPRVIGQQSAAFKVKQTWRSPLAKADPELPDYEWLHQIADAQAPEIRRRFLAAIAAIRGTIQEAALRDALERKDLTGVMAILGLDKNFTGLEPSLLQPLTSTVHQAAVGALDATPVLARLGGSLSLRFDVVNPHTVQAVRNYGFNLIQQVTEDTRDGIRQIVADAMEFGGHPYEQARQIRNLVGLTENQAAAVGNFRRMLVEGDRQVLTRALRDKRFDGTLRRALGEAATHQLSPEQIDQMTARYGERMLAARAETIARTETINAARLGTQAAWLQSAETGLLVHNKIRQGWMVTPDDRLCIYCAEVPDMNPDGVPLGGMFQTPLGPVSGPTLHPQCRCIVYLLTF